MWSLKIGLHGLICFSTRPLFIWYVFQKLLGIPLTPGLSTRVLVVTFFSGIQLLALGLMGEYVGRIYDEVKRRLMYVINRKVNLS